MFDNQIHAARRAAVQAAMRREGGGAMLLPAADEKARNADNHFPFRQDSDFAWLTGFDEPEGAALVLADPAEGRSGLVLFVRPKDREREIWDGFRAGVEGAVSDPRRRRRPPGRRDGGQARGAPGPRRGALVPARLLPRMGRAGGADRPEAARPRAHRRPRARPGAGPRGRSSTSSGS